MKYFFQTNTPAHLSKQIHATVLLCPLLALSVRYVSNSSEGTELLVGVNCNVSILSNKYHNRKQSIDGKYCICYLWLREQSVSALAILCQRTAIGNGLQNDQPPGSQLSARS